jgi:hypothetical protein
MMQEIVRTLSEQPLVAMGIALVVLVVLYFLFSKIIKLVLIVGLAAIVAWGYFHFQKPGQRPASFGEAVEQVRAGAARLAELGKSAYGVGRELVETGRDGVEKGGELLDRGKTVLGQGIDKGRETVGRGKDAAGDLARRLGGEKKANP